MKTVGFSPKAVLAFLLPAIGTLVLAILDQALSPAMDPSLKVAIVGLVAPVLAFAGAWAGDPGAVIHELAVWGPEKLAPPSHGSGIAFASTYTTPGAVGAHVVNTPPDPGFDFTALRDDIAALRAELAAARVTPPA